VRIKCNSCNKTLTKDLFKTKWPRHTTPDDETRLIDYVNYFVPRGGFIKTKFHCSRKNLLHVSRKDFLEGVLLEYREGLGCCDISQMEFVCSCGEVLGDYSLDCWNTRSVDLLENKVRRVYK
jgi:hypothetical protein